MVHITWLEALTALVTGVTVTLALRWLLGLALYRARRWSAKRAIRRQLQLIRNERAARPIFTGHGYLEERRKHQRHPVDRHERGDDNNAA